MATPTTTSNSNLALLIDGDNVSPKIIVALIAEIASYGTASVRRIYGDWTNPSLNGWKACLLDNSIQPIQQFAYTKGKNATDGAMIIDAMDLLYTGRFAGFCLVSSDSDFTRLAARIREQGVTVYGFGERKTHTAFIASCDKFVYFDALKTPVDQPGGLSLTYRGPQTSLQPSTTAHPSSLSQTPSSTTDPFKRPIDPPALEALAKAVHNCVGDDDYANLADVGHYLRKISPDLNARNYGYDRLKDFVEASGIVHLKWKNMGANPPVALVSLKK
jgi:hypothetical protein